MRQPLYHGLLQSDLNAAGYRITGVKGVGFVRPTTLVASQRGAILDSNLVTGGGTNDTAVLQAALDVALTAGQPITLLIDGPALVSGLDVHPNTEVICLPGAGFYLANGANRPIVRNANPTRSTIVDSNITLRGGIYNGNQAHQSHHIGDGTWVVPIGFYGVDGLVLQDVTVRNPRTFGVHIANWKHATIRNHRTDMTVPGTTPEQLNQDAIHFNGPGQFAHLSNITGTSWDDFIAFNADDGVGVMTSTNELGPYVGQGDITDVTIDGVRMSESLFGIRLLSKTSRIDRVTIRNVKGTTRGHYLLLDNFPDGSVYNASTTGNFGKITVEDVDVQPHDQVFADLAIQVGGRIDQITFRDIRKTNLNDVHANYGFIVVNPYADVRQFAIDGLTVSDTGAMDVEQTALVIIQGKIKRLNITNVDWLRDSAVVVNGSLLQVKDTTSDVKALTLSNVFANHTFNVVAVNLTSGYTNAGAGTLRELRVSNLVNENPHSGSGLLFVDAGLSVWPRLTVNGFRGSALVVGTGAASVSDTAGDAFATVTDTLIFTWDGMVVTTVIKTGLIANVVRVSAGNYHITFTQDVANYVPSVMASNDNTAPHVICLGGVLPGAASVTGFFIAISDPTPTAVDASLVMVTVARPVVIAS